MVPDSYPVRRWLRAGATAIAFAAVVPLAAAQDMNEAQTRILSDATLRTATLSVASCNDDASTADCVSHELICDRTGVLKLYLGEEYNAGNQLAQIAQAIIAAPYPGAPVKAELGSAAEQTDLTVVGVQAVGNDISGHWDFQLLLGKGSRLLELLSAAEAPGFMLTLSGLKLEFAPGQNDVPKLAEFGKRCTAYVNAPAASAAATAPVPKPTEKPAVKPPTKAIAEVKGGTSGLAAVRGFYDALADGDGPRAAAFIVAEKRNRGGFSAAAMSNFYGRLTESLHLLSIEPAEGGEYLATYTFRNRGDRCAGRALVRTVPSGRGYLIRSIRALNGC